MMRRESSSETELEVGAPSLDVLGTFGAEDISRLDQGHSQSTEGRSVATETGAQPTNGVFHYENNRYAKYMQRQRAAQGRVLFDPDAVRILDTLATAPRYQVDKIQAIVVDAAGWLRLGLLMQAQFVEPVGLDFAVTTDGRDALSRLESFLTDFAQDDQDSAH